MSLIDSNPKIFKKKKKELIDKSQYNLVSGVDFLLVMTRCVLYGDKERGGAIVSRRFV